MAFCRRDRLYRCGVRVETCWLECLGKKRILSVLRGFRRLLCVCAVTMTTQLCDRNDAHHVTLPSQGVPKRRHEVTLWQYSSTPRCPDTLNVMLRKVDINSFLVRRSIQFHICSTTTSPPSYKNHHQTTEIFLRINTLCNARLRLHQVLSQSFPRRYR